MRKFIILVLVLTFAGTGVASAHQPVVLLNSDTTAAKGPLLVDGTVSFAIRASFTKAGEKKAFRAAFKQGDQLNVQYLIVDKKPENTLRTTQLPTLVITSPKGTSVTMKFNERTKFFEPFSGVNYLYLARYTASAQPGEYSFVITAKGKAAITIGVGEKEIPGQVSRAAGPTTSPAPSQSPTPAPSPTTAAYTMDQVRANNSANSCWSVIDGYVYNLTKWINSHPGGSAAITSLCGTDGSSAFSSQHGGQSRPNRQLDNYRLGPLEK